jgi:GNAT superfamily N-acetyltransferase
MTGAPLETTVVEAVVVRAALRSDVDQIYQFICELARYEKLEHEVAASAADIEVALFGPTPRAYCDLAEHRGETVGFALWFYNFSTFNGRAGLYLEDLFVRPEARGLGAGKALLKQLAQRCIQEDLSRMDWSVLDWNAPSIAFYDQLGAEAKSEWILRRLAGESLRRLAG